MFSPQSPPDQKGQAKRNLPNSSAQINPCGRRFGVYALANVQPFLVLASLFLKSFSYPPSHHTPVSSHVYRVCRKDTRCTQSRTHQNAHLKIEESAGPLKSED